VPAELSSPIPPGLASLCDASPLAEAEPTHLLAYLAAVPDPRAARGRRHRLVAILAMAAAAVLTFARSFAAIAEWAADTPQPIRAALGARHDPLADGFLVPTETTIRRTLGRLDAHALPAAVGDWLVARDRHDHPAPAQRPRQRAVAIDGKTLRGAHSPDGHSRPVHLLAAMEHTSRVVLAASGMLAVAAGNPACPGPGDRRALEAGFAACLPGAAWMTPE
jgi:DDE_Tnp_1-associated